MASARTFEVDEGVVSSPVVKVNKACRYFGEKGDEGLAHNLQGKEFDKKYDWNREVRRIARTDVPLARAAYDEEEERIQRQRLEFLQNQTKLAEADAKLARDIQREEENLAKEEYERRRRRTEAKDRELAKRFDEMGFRDEYNSSKVDEEEDGRGWNSSGSPDRPLGIDKLAYLQSFAGLGVRRLRDGDDDDDLPEDERMQLMLLQDQELALALQEYESLKALRAERHRIQEENRLQGSEEEDKTNGQKTDLVDSSSSSSSP